MIATLLPSCSLHDVQILAARHQAIPVSFRGRSVLVFPSKLKVLPEDFAPFVSEAIDTGSDIQLSSKKFASAAAIDFAGNTLGGDSGNTILITGPCSVESEEQIEACAQFCVSQNIRVLRAGAYKPRTSPYTFQGMGLEGLRLLDRMRSKYGLKIITEVRDSSHVQEVIEWADIVQIGAKAMYDHGILKACGKANKPILLKRGFGSSLQEFVQAAEFILSSGNERVLLCERGIRTFETKTRFTLDLCGVAWLKENINLPIILDPSHAIGWAYGVPDLTRACMAMGVDGLLIESHPQPAKAMSDADQQLNFNEFSELKASLLPIASAIGRNLI
jgi:3-deoxy-7-phosphoheptulonate synthase